MDDFEACIDFPPISTATEDGLLMVGGILCPSWVVAAYQRGIFPWPIVDDGCEILAWFSPDPRAVLDLEQLYISRRLARRIRSGRFRVTCDQDFAAVVAGCAAPRGALDGTWITPAMQRTYRELHEMRVVHSVEVWRDSVLVGGLYGVSIGAFFAGESMFHHERDASQVALAYLVAHLRARGFRLFDVQQATEHVVRMGAHEIPRNEFLRRLIDSVASPVSFGETMDTSLLATMLQR